MKDLLRTKFLQPQQRKKITNNTQRPNPYYYPWNDLQDLFSVFFNPLRNYSSQMGKRRYGFLLILSFVAILGLISFLSCLAAELKRTKKKDLKLYGRFCYLPKSHAFRFGIVALICFVIAQIIGNLIVILYLCYKDKRRNGKLKNKQNIFFIPLLVISWISFGIAITIISSGTSMSTKQPYEKGWLNGECYLVKDGVFVGSAILVLITIGSTLGSAMITMKRETQVDQEFKVEETDVGNKTLE